MEVPSGDAVKKQSWERAVGATLPPALLHEYFICNLLAAKNFLPVFGIHTKGRYNKHTNLF